MYVCMYVCIYVCMYNISIYKKVLTKMSCRYPVLETVQKYLWPRLCKLDQRTLYNHNPKNLH